MNDFFKDQLPTIITAIAGLSAWIYEKRKKNAELQVAESDAIAAMQASYKTFVADMNANYVELKTKVESLEREVIEWKSKYESLRAEMNSIENNVQTTPNNGKQ